ncbi:hypothetical protein [Pelagibacterium limicola]|uniref:hypothetical protein n=1 Tax=Pelagibacterium limicola TaxID=2791022 RepID=UPI0018AF5585|nr:hypothetical protein [Pelagibacterium limicola]
MSYNAKQQDSTHEPLRVLWTGRSGRRYVLTAVEMDGFALREGQLYVLATEGTIRWAGVAGDLIADHASRARFRATLGEGAVIMNLPAPVDELARLTLVWDLEGTHAHPGRTAA